MSTESPVPTPEQPKKGDIVPTLDDLERRVSTANIRSFVFSLFLREASKIAHRCVRDTDIPRAITSGQALLADYPIGEFRRPVRIWDLASSAVVLADTLTSQKQRQDLVDRYRWRDAKLSKEHFHIAAVEFSSEVRARQADQHFEPRFGDVGSVTDAIENRALEAQLISATARQIDVLRTVGWVQTTQLRQLYEVFHHCQPAELEEAAFLKKMEYIRLKLGHISYTRQKPEGPDVTLVSVPLAMGSVYYEMAQESENRPSMDAVLGEEEPGILKVEQDILSRALRTSRILLRKGFEDYRPVREESLDMVFHEESGWPKQR